MFNFLKKSKKTKEMNLSELPDLPKLPDLPSTFNKQPRAMPSLDIPEIKVKPRKEERFDFTQPIEIQPEKTRTEKLKTMVKKPLDVLAKARRYEEQAVKEEEEELEEIHEHSNARPIYVEGTIFKQMLTDISIMNNQLKESYDALEKVKAIEKRKDTKFNNFKSSLLNVQRKLIFVDKLLFKSR